MFILFFDNISSLITLLGLQRSMGVYRYGRPKEWKKHTIKPDLIISIIQGMAEE